MYLLNRRSVNKAKPYLLLHCNGADASTTFTDSSPEAHTFSAAADAQIDTAQYKFSGSSMLLDGAGDYISTTDGDFNLTTNWTYEQFVRMSAVTSTRVFAIFHDGEGSPSSWALYQTASTGLIFTVDDTGSTIVTVTSAELSINTWYHVAVCKVGNEYGIYTNGTQTAHTSDSSTVAIGLGGALLFGSSAGSNYFAGHMDEIRIVAGNPFKATPVVGKTDKIQVPQQPYPSWS